MMLLAQDATDPSIVAIICGLVYGVIQFLITIFKLVFDKTIPNKNDKDIERLSDKFKKIEYYTRELHDMHNKFDIDGTPLWYVPRSWSETQDKILDCVKEISGTQKELGKIMEKTVGVLDRIDRRDHKG